MKLLFLTSGKHTPATRFRAVAWVEPLRAAGHHCTVAHSIPDKYEHYRWLGFRLSQKLKRLRRYGDLLRVKWGGYDAVIIERELFNDPTWDMEAKFRRAVGTLVLDIDDALFLTFPEKFAKLLAATLEAVTKMRNKASAAKSSVTALHRPERLQSGKA
jgi:hypothetical protein